MTGSMWRKCRRDLCVAAFEESGVCLVSYAQSAIALVPSTLGLILDRWTGLDQLDRAHTMDGLQLDRAYTNQQVDRAYARDCPVQVVACMLYLVHLYDPEGCACLQGIRAAQHVCSRCISFCQTRSS
eukprot:jgi/Ulvmu1/2434/UM134_0015.1